MMFSLKLLVSVVAVVSQVCLAYPTKEWNAESDTIKEAAEKEGLGDEFWLNFGGFEQVAKKKGRSLAPRRAYNLKVKNQGLGDEYWLEDAAQEEGLGAKRFKETAMKESRPGGFEHLVKRKGRPLPHLKAYKVKNQGLGDEYWLQDAETEEQGLGDEYWVEEIARKESRPGGFEHLAKRKRPQKVPTPKEYIIKNQGLLGDDEYWLEDTAEEEGYGDEYWLKEIARKQRQPGGFEEPSKRKGREYWFQEVAKNEGRPDGWDHLVKITGRPFPSRVRPQPKAERAMWPGYGDG